MGNKNRVKGGITEYQRIAAQALGHRIKSQDEYRRMILAEREQYEGFMKSVELNPYAHQTDVISESNRKRFRKEFDDDIHRFDVFARKALVMPWIKSRRIFNIKADTYDFIMNKFDPTYVIDEPKDLWPATLYSPMLLTFDGDPEMDGALVGTVPSGTVEDGEGNHHIAYSIYVVSLYKSHDALYAGELPLGDCHSVGDILEGDKIGDEVIKRATRILIYVAFLITRCDAKRFVGASWRDGTALVQNVPILDSPYSLPKGDAEERIAAGLTYYYGFAERQNLLKDFNRKVGEYYAEGPSSYVELCKANACQAAVMWEKNRIAYIYNDKTVKELHQDIPEHAFVHFSDDVLAYMPDTPIMLYNSSEDTFTIVWKSTMFSDGVTYFYLGHFDKREPIYNTIIGVDTDSLPWIEEFEKVHGWGEPDSYYKAVTLDGSAPVSEQMSVLWRILTVYKERSEARLAMEAPMSPEERESYSDAMRSAYAESVQTSSKEKGDIHISYDIPVTELFNVTASTVKRRKGKSDYVPGANGGWVMIPHSRRPHPHRYWVGHGENKHLEVRWLAEIKVHADKQSESTSIHRMEL